MLGSYEAKRLRGQESFISQNVLASELPSIQAFQLNCYFLLARLSVDAAK